MLTPTARTRAGRPIQPDAPSSGSANGRRRNGEGLSKGALRRIADLRRSSCRTFCAVSTTSVADAGWSSSRTASPPSSTAGSSAGSPTCTTRSRTPIRSTASAGGRWPAPSSRRRPSWSLFWRRPCWQLCCSCSSRCCSPRCISPPSSSPLSLSSSCVSRS